MKFLLAKLVTLRMRSDIAPWSAIFLLTVAFLLPYFFAREALLNLQVYNAVSIIPLFTGAYLRERRGVLLPWAIIFSTEQVLIITAYGTYWPRSIVIECEIGNLIGLGLGLMIASFFSIKRHLDDAHAQLMKAHADLEQQALTDAVTGLPNRRAILLRLEQEIERTCRSDRPFALVFLDGDHFKKVNDTYGHAVGDVVLRQLGERASSVLRAGDTLGRLGGEEFIALLPQTASREAILVAERLRAAIAAHPLVSSEVEGGIPVTVSVGVASYSDDGATSDALLEQADLAMYCAKARGRNQVRTASEAERLRLKGLLLSSLPSEEEEGLSQHDDDERDKTLVATRP
jgi:diguanylate cyclase (GGDEF)-like protein